MKALYFAYGLCLEEHTMVDYHPSARFYLFATLRGFKLIFSGDGVCSIDKGSFNDIVEGVLYTVDKRELSEPREDSSLSILDIMGHEGNYVSAHVYYTNRKDLVAPNQDYLMRVHKKYQDYGFNITPLENALDKSNYQGTEQEEDTVCGSLLSL